MAERDRNLLQLSDEDLFALYQKGNYEAFPVLLARYRKPLYNFLHRLLGNTETADEAFQETFMRVIKSANEYKPTAKFSTWLYTIARNYGIDQKRKERFRNHMSLDDVNDQTANQVDQALSSNAQIAEITTTKELQAHLRAGLNELSSEQREVFVLREFQGLSFDEIGKVTGTSVNTVKSRMRYALTGLQKIFLELGIKLE
ncbi:MAG: hypothetical protein ACD_62C00395G0018 [uncultured bacterium]|nr:MAG: hypothetical protein ACD_62C00395G0018 [uncultured bacterium]